MVVGEIAEGADLLVVGAGPGGYAAALRGAQAGRKVTLVDRDGEDGVGGVCLRTGCIPSKTLIEVAETVHRARQLASAGIAPGSADVDMERFQGHKDTVVAKLTGGVRGLLRAAGVRIVHGDLRFTRPDQAVVHVGGDSPPAHLQFRDAIIATGSHPLTLAALPVDGRTILDSTGALALDHLPATVAVVGGGYIGLEIGIALAKLGSAVTLVESLDRLLPGMDAIVARPLQRRLAQLGVQVRLGATATGHEGGKLAIESGGGAEQVPADIVVVAVGRAPNTHELGLDALGISAMPDGRLAVGADRRLTPHVCAIGDITPGPALAHKASAEAQVAVDALCGKRVRFDPAAIPSVVFSDPEIAFAGLSEDEARAAGIRVRSAVFPVRASGRAATSGAVEGFLRLVADVDADAVVGVQIVGPHASELIAEGVLAIELAASPEDLGAAIHPHPTMSELHAEAAHVWLGRPLHVAAGPAPAKEAS